MAKERLCLFFKISGCHLTACFQQCLESPTTLQHYPSPNTRYLSVPGLGSLRK